MQLKYLLILISLQIFTNEAIAQNTPNLSQSANPNTFSNISTPPEVHTGTGLINSVTTFTPVIPIKDTASVNSGSPASDVRQQIIFLDGLQRPYQSITKNIAVVNSVNKHLVQIFDNRPTAEKYSFLPFSSNTSSINTNAFQAQRNYYNVAFPNEGYSSFSKSISTSTTVERSETNFAPGKSGVGLEIGNRSKMITNSSSQIIVWTLDGNGSPVANGYYPAGQLFGKEGSDPDASGANYNNSSPRTRIYSDKDGKIILKLIADSSYTVTSGNNFSAFTTYTSTYYVYDQKGHLRLTITPKAFKYYQSQNGLTSSIINNLCFQYQYDAKGRLSGVMKPGENGFTYVVYDRKNRAVMRQTPNERLAKEWEVTFLDALGRTKVTSIYTDNAAIDHNAWQTNIDNWTSGGNYAQLMNYLTNPLLESQYPIGANPVGDVSNNANSLIAGNSIMTVNYYDDYSQLDPNNTAFYECHNTIGLTELSGNGAEPILQGLRNYGMATGSIVKILRSPTAGTSTKVGDWRTTLNFYDDKGKIINSKSFVTDNVNGQTIINTDYNGIQYDFANRVLVSGHVFTNSNSQDNALGSTHTEFTKNQYDPITGNLTKTVHQVDGGDWKILGSYSYDDMGKLKSKTLGAGGEVQEMTYNIRSQISGINGGYAETGNKGGYSKTFGESLKYDYGFTQPRFDSRISGMVWRGSTSTDMYSYGYDYTMNGALKRADFNYWQNNSWSNSNIDYSVLNLFYDKNGNMISMKQRGMKPNSGPVDMDVLSYTYENDDISNRLEKVTDAGVGNFGAGDFQGTASNSYDDNGNLTKDLGAKNLDSISYTRFNKPVFIHLVNGGTFEYSYDALGTKVEELIIDPSLSQSKRIDYIANAVYRNTYENNGSSGDNTDSLQYLTNIEGRSVPNYSQNNINEEYFVKDHLGNLRSVINVSSYPIVQYLATYELASAHLEDLVFDNIEDIRDIKPGGVGDNTMAANLNGGDSRRTIGTSLLLHVMAGDKVSMNVSTYFNGYDKSQDVPLSSSSVMNQIISTLVGGQGGFGGSESHNTKMVQTVFTPTNYQTYDQVIQSATDPSLPKAYLNYVLFDENMHVVKNMSGAFQASGNSDWAQIGTTSALEIPTNGYLAVYQSNTSTNIKCTACSDVYFDQMSVVLSQGKLLEENHYYPHGLPIFGIGSKTATNEYRTNRFRYQSNEYITDQGLNWMSFGARQYDPQIGRFLSVDPMAMFGGQEVYAPYVAMGNRAESSIDPNGLIPNLQLAESYGGDAAGGWGTSLKWLINGGEHIGTYSGGGGSNSDYGSNGQSITLYGAAAQKAFAQMTGQTDKLAGDGGGDKVATDDASSTTQNSQPIELANVDVKAPGFFSKIWSGIKSAASDSWNYVKGLHFDFSLNANVTFGAQIGASGHVGSLGAGANVYPVAIELAETHVSVSGAIDNPTANVEGSTILSKDGQYKVTNGLNGVIGVASGTVENTFKAGTTSPNDQLRVNGGALLLNAEKTVPMSDDAKPVNNNFGIHAEAGAEARFILGIQLTVKIGVSHD